MTDLLNSGPGKVIGIFGGMGPEATIDLFNRITQITEAGCDQDHIPVLVYSLPQVPDRTKCINSGDESIIPFLKDGVTRLEKAGASFITIPCNAAHYYYDIMQNSVGIPIVHMIRETKKEVLQTFPDVKNIGLLATTGTVKTEVYHKEYEKNGFCIITPSGDIQESKVMQAVYGNNGIKAAGPNKTNEKLLTEAADYLISKGAEAIILGCTEIPLAFNKDSISVPLINATNILAKAAVREYYK